MKVMKGNVTSEITEGNLKADILKGTTDVLSEGKITITGNNTTEIISNTTVTGTLHVTGAKQMIQQFMRREILELTMERYNTGNS